MESFNIKKVFFMVLRTKDYFVAKVEIKRLLATASRLTMTNGIFCFDNRKHMI